MKNVYFKGKTCSKDLKIALEKAVKEENYELAKIIDKTI